MGKGVKGKGIDFLLMNGYKSIMKVNPFKMISLILLVSAALMLTGFSESFSSAFLEKAEKSCCDECNNGEEKTPGANHCSTPDCPLFVCLAINIDSPFVLSTSFEGIYVPLFSPEPILKPLPKSIFHPPRFI